MSKRHREEGKREREKGSPRERGKGKGKGKDAAGCLPKSWACWSKTTLVKKGVVGLSAMLDGSEEAVHPNAKIAS